MPRFDRPISHGKTYDDLVEDPGAMRRQRARERSAKLMLWCPKCHDGPFASGPCMNCGAAIETPQSPTIGETH